MTFRKLPQKDDIQKLSRGLPTRARIGSRGVPHRLTQRERQLFEAAKRKGFLQIPASGARENVSNVYHLWCEATGRDCKIRQPIADQESHKIFSRIVPSENES